MSNTKNGVARGRQWAPTAIASIALLLLCSSTSFATPAVVQWDANTDGVTTGYRVFYGSAPGTYDLSGAQGTPVVGVGTTTLQVDLTVGQVYYFMVRAENVNGLGPPSDEVPFMHFTDPALTVQATFIRRAHITELRALIDATRASAAGLGAFSWTDPTITAQTTQISAQHIRDLRTAIVAVYTALSRTPPAFTDPTLTEGGTAVKRAHLVEIRDAAYAVFNP